MRLLCSCAALFVSLLFVAGAASANVKEYTLDFADGELAGWESPYLGTFFSLTDETVHTGRFALQGRGDPEHRNNDFIFLRYDLDLTPIPGARYSIAGQVRGKVAPGNKRAALAVREADADDKTIRYHEALMEPSAEQWTPVSRTFRVSEGTTSLQIYVILSNLDTTDRIYLDDIRFTALDVTGLPLTARPLPFSGRTGRVWVDYGADVIDLDNDIYTVLINMRTGLLSGMLSKQPTPQVIHPPAQDVTRIFFQYHDREVHFSRIIEPLSRRAGLQWEEATVVLGPDDPEIPLQARVTYRLEQEHFTEHVVFEATEDLPSLCRLGVRHGFIADDWRRSISALRPVRVIDADEETLFSYGEKERDLQPTRLDKWQSPVYPMTVLDGEDRWLMVGQMNLDNFVTLAPNHPRGYFPSVQHNPVGLQQSDTFEFALTWRVFPRTTHLLRDVWRWYGEHAESDNPLLRDAVPFLPGPPRSLPPGPLVTAGAHFNRETPGIHTDRTLPGANIWFFGWLDWINERYPVEGQWWARMAGWQRMDAEHFRNELRRYSEEGFKSYLYFRHIANLAQRGTKVPEEWIRGEPGGALELWGGGYIVKVPEEMVEELGYSEMPWGIYNFSSDSFREDYIAQVMACMEYYRPAGIAWDMGWEPTNPGILAVQAEVFRLLREQYPEMRIIANEASGSPSSWYADAVMLENGIIYGKTVWDYEVSKGYGAQIFSLERNTFFFDVARKILAGESDWVYPGGFADAQRCAEWLLGEGGMNPELTLPADAQAREQELGHRLHLRAGIRAFGLGANWAYADLWGKTFPEPLRRLITDLSALPLVAESFAVTLHPAPADPPLVHAAAWAGPQELRVTVYNDDTRPAAHTVRISREALAGHGFTLADTARPTAAWVINPVGELQEITPEGVMGEEYLEFSLSLPPFSLWVVEYGG